MVEWKRARKSGRPGRVDSSAFRYQYFAAKPAPVLSPLSPQLYHLVVAVALSAARQAYAGQATRLLKARQATPQRLPRKRAIFIPAPRPISTGGINQPAMSELGE